jgi:hypothetical protein
LEDPTAGKHLEGIGDAMKKDGRSTMNGDECRKIMGVVTKATGFDADTIQAAIDAKKTEFNGDKAAACYAALSTHEATSTRAASAIPSPMPLHASYVRPGRASTVSSWRAKSPQT